MFELYAKRDKEQVNQRSVAKFMDKIRNILKFGKKFGNYIKLYQTFN